MTLDYRLPNRTSVRARGGLPQLEKADRLRPRLRMPVMSAKRRPGDTRSRQRMLHELAHLPPARRGPVLQNRRTAVPRPVAERRAQRRAPLLTRLVAGELQHRLVLVLAGLTIFVALVTLLGADLFL